MSILAYSSIVIFFTAFVNLSLQVKTYRGKVSLSYQPSESLSEASPSLSRLSEPILGASPSAKVPKVYRASDTQHDHSSIERTSPTLPVAEGDKNGDTMKASESRRLSTKPKKFRRPSTKPEKEHYIEEYRYNPYLKKHQSTMIKQTPKQHREWKRRFDRVRAKKDHVKKVTSLDPGK
ncbi:uncharacterized protein FA14DRAFT_157205 [Meira miltonrushii]|uniref:Uncharacterized protein n=1 Tax=Meira miltonrushii TaxID=1280837 RepID=A0A316V639_9BASI|nr:uncharacterized protein FA14DRAFT_157205 [Meira miltonrushii]PWN32488.1 hypothetical protein FA14DRAFT_157205 [Meira miltonrushii]